MQGGGAKLTGGRVQHSLLPESELPVGSGEGLEEEAYIDFDALETQLLLDEVALFFIFVFVFRRALSTPSLPFLSIPFLTFFTPIFSC